MVWTSWLPVTVLFNLAIYILIGVYVYTKSLHTFELPTRVPVPVDGELQDGVTDQSKALVGLRAVKAGRVECFVEEVEVLEGVAESVADELEVSD